MIPVNYSKALRRPVPWVLVAASATAAAVLLLASPAWAGGGRGGHDMDAGEPGGMPGMGMGMHPRMLDRMAEELSLSDEQRQKIRGLFEAARPAMEQRREKMRADAELLRNTDPGSKDYQAVVQKVSRSAGELAASGVADAAQLRAQVWAVLTPEQRTKARAMGDKMRDRMEERREMRNKMREDRRKSRDGGPPPPPPPAP